MRSKPLVLLLAMVSGALVATGAGRLTGNSQSLPETDSVEVLVAARQIDPGDSIAIEMLAIKSWPATLAPVGVISEIGLLDRQTVVMPVSAGDPILRNNVIDLALAALNPAEQSPAGTPVEAPKQQQEPPPVDPVPPPVPAGFSVVSLTLDESTGLAHLVRPGDRVNVSAYFTPTEHCSLAGFQQVLRGAKIFSVTGRSFHQVAPVDEQPLPMTISLLIRTADEEAWTIAHELGRVKVSLASVDDPTPDESPVPTSKEFLAWVSARLQPSAKASGLTHQPDLAPQSISQMTQSSGFRMLKLHGGEWTEYEVVSADRPPVMISSSRRHAEQDHAGVSSRVEGGRLLKDLAEPESSAPSWMGHSAESANPDDGV
jgi:pilus assembly protein CpaB